MLNGYELSRQFWDFAFENPDKIKPTHVSIYFFAIEHCNRLGWKERYGLPASMVIEAIGIKSYSVYKKAFDELVEYGFFEVVQYAKNQYSSNIIALKENNKAHCKALDKAFGKHLTKQVESTLQSTVSTDKPLTIEPLNQEQENRYTQTDLFFLWDTDSFKKSFYEWCQYRIEKHKSPYIRSESEKVLKELYREAKTESEAILIIDKSIAKGAKNLIFDYGNNRNNSNGFGNGSAGTESKIRTGDRKDFDRN